MTREGEWGRLIAACFLPRSFQCRAYKALHVRMVRCRPQPGAAQSWFAPTAAGAMRSELPGKAGSKTHRRYVSSTCVIP